MCFEAAFQSGLFAIIGAVTLLALWANDPAGWGWNQRLARVNGRSGLKHEFLDFPKFKQTKLLNNGPVGVDGI